MFKTKLGTNKGLQRSRVWIEGKRLTESGFYRGALYNREYGKTSIILTLSESGSLRVSGKADKPIIDMTGKSVSLWFEGYESAFVYYARNQIIIKRGEPL